MTGRTSRSKGARGENEVVELLRTHWPRATRNWMSGAGGNGDIVHGPAHVVWEVKRTDRLRLRESWKQAEGAAAAAGIGELPVLATRWNGGRWLAVIELEELLALLHLRETA
jgi:hypothetical protein